MSLENKYCCLKFNGLEWRHTSAAIIDHAVSMDLDTDNVPSTTDLDIDDTTRLYLYPVHMWTSIPSRMAI